jgi:hypothetical protein
VNREGAVLLGLVIGRIAGIEEEVRRGDCKVIAAVVNQIMPPEMQLTPADVYQAIRNRPDFPEITMNAHILRARIDAIPVLYSARLNADAGGMQTILNELIKDTDLVPVPSLDDVKAAMALRREPKPELVVCGAASLVGAARVG